MPSLWLCGKEKVLKMEVAFSGLCPKRLQICTGSYTVTSVGFDFLADTKTSVREISNMEDMNKIPQRKKNVSGRAKMIPFSAGSKIQLSFPGKKILWKITKVLSKSMEPSPPTSAKIPRVPNPLIKE